MVYLVYFILLSCTPLVLLVGNLVKGASRSEREAASIASAAAPRRRRSLRLPALRVPSFRRPRLGVRAWIDARADQRVRHTPSGAGSLAAQAGPVAAPAPYVARQDAEPDAELAPAPVPAFLSAAARPVAPAYAAPVAPPAPVAVTAPRSDAERSAALSRLAAATVAPAEPVAAAAPAPAPVVAAEPVLPITASPSGWVPAPPSAFQAAPALTPRPSAEVIAFPNRFPEELAAAR